MKVGHLVIATNRYMEFVPPLLESAREFFLPGHEMTMYVLTNLPEVPEGCVRVEQEHRPWPAMTLERYEMFHRNRDMFAGEDYLYYTDADMLFVDTVGDEVLGELVVTTHPGFYNAPPTVFPHENNPKSTAYVAPPQRRRYVAGGFNGGTRDAFLEMSKTISTNIHKDAEWGYTAEWHDESHLNRYIVDHPPEKVLDCSYCFPKDAPWAAQHPFRPTMKLCPVEKKHSEFQV